MTYILKDKDLFKIIIVQFYIFKKLYEINYGSQNKLFYLIFINSYLNQQLIEK